MRATMDKVSYARGNPPGVPNVLTLVKRFGPGGSNGHEERAERQRSPSVTTESE
jgi:hypothetical protein